MSPHTPLRPCSVPRPPVLLASLHRPHASSWRGTAAGPPPLTCVMAPKPTHHSLRQSHSHRIRLTASARGAPRGSRRGGRRRAQRREGRRYLHQQPHLHRRRWTSSCVVISPPGHPRCAGPRPRSASRLGHRTSSPRASLSSQCAPDAEPPRCVQLRQAPGGLGAWRRQSFAATADGWSVLNSAAKIRNKNNHELLP